MNAETAEYSRRYLAPRLVQGKTWLLYGLILRSTRSSTTSGIIHRNAQYAIELPPAHCRPYVKKMILDLCSYEGVRSQDHAALDASDRHPPVGRHHQPRWQRIHLGYTDKSNDWLEPVKSLASYGFTNLSSVVLRVRVGRTSDWKSEQTDAFHVWIMEQLIANSESKKLLTSGVLHVDLSRLTKT